MIITIIKLKHFVKVFFEIKSQKINVGQHLEIFIIFLQSFVKLALFRIRYTYMYYFLNFALGDTKNKVKIKVNKKLK